MTSAKLIEERTKGLRTKFSVEINLNGFNDEDLRRMAKELRSISWDFADDLADIIERKE